MELLYIENTWKFFQKFVRVTEPVVNRFAAYILNTISGNGNDNIKLPVMRTLSI